MRWEFLIFASIGAFLVLVYVLREWLLWRDDQRRRRIPLYGYRVSAARHNVRRG
jgi:hypothetical protein